MLYELEDSITPWGWQTVILAAAVLREHETMSDEDYNSIIALVGPDTHEGVPEYATKAFSTAVTYLVQRQEAYEEMLREAKKDALLDAQLREMLGTPQGRAKVRVMLAETDPLREFKPTDGPYSPGITF